MPGLGGQEVEGVPEPSREEECSQSDDGFFMIYGGTPAVRNVLLREGEKLQRQLRDLVGRGEGEGPSVVIELHPPRAGRGSEVRSRLLLLPEQQGAMRLQVDVLLGRGKALDWEEMRQTLLAMALYDRTLRGRKAGEVQGRVLVAPWLVVGLLEAFAWREGKGERARYESLAQQKSWMSVEELLQAEKFPKGQVLRAEIFRASAGALVMALLSQPQGSKALGEYLSEVALFEGEPLELVSRHFPEVNRGPQGLAKWWMLQVAAMAQAPLSQSMTPQETEAQLARILKLRFPASEGAGLRMEPLSRWPELLELKGEQRVEGVQATMSLLSQLSNRCFPTYRPVIVGYLDFLGALGEGKGDKLAEMEQNLAQFRAAELARAQRVRDLLDWYHLSTVTEESGQFEEYFKLQEVLGEGGEAGLRDPVMHYVDQVEALFSRPSEGGGG